VLLIRPRSKPRTAREGVVGLEGEDEDTSVCVSLSSLFVLTLWMLVRFIAVEALAMEWLVVCL
jgi:hypothetical protein